MTHSNIFPFISTYSFLNFNVYKEQLCSYSVVFQSLSLIWLFVTSWTAACQASLSFTISQSLLILMSIESVIPSNHLIPCHRRILLPSVFSNIRVFSNESYQVAKVMELQLQHQSFQRIFRVDFL